jgi:hypothetical protein
MKKYFSSPFGRAMQVTVVLDAVATAVLAMTGKAGWVAGVWLSAAWFLVNSLMMWRIMEWVASGQMPDQRRILGWCVVKFPVLYLAGLGLLMIPGVEVSGVLVTFTSFLIGLAIAQALNIGKKP